MSHTTVVASPEIRRPASFHEDIPSWGLLQLIPVVPMDDVDLIHGWVAEKRAKYWCMTSYTRSDVLEVYEYLDGLDTHQAYLVELEGEPFGIFQTYRAMHDPVGEAYPALSGDTGMHLLLGPASRYVPHFTPILADVLIRFMFEDRTTTRIIAEPDARNIKAIRRLLASSFHLGPVIQLGNKEAQLAFLTRTTLPAN